jgi:hypothetical protein
MRADKLEQLTALLRAIPPDKAVALARAVETMRQSESGNFPADAVLDALAPALAAARRQRYALQPMALAALDPFLTDDDATERAPGLLARTVIVPWWTAIGLVAAGDFATLQAELDRLARRDDETPLAEFAVRVRTAAATATAQLLEQMKSGTASPAVRALVQTARQRADIEQIGEILGAGETLRAAIEAVMDLARRDQKMEGSVILDLSPTIVTETKRCYEALSAGSGVETRLFALAILNRLDKPWHIFRLARALSWKRDATLVANTELAVIGQRLLHNLDATASAVNAANPKGRMSAHLVDFDLLRALIGRYIEGAEGLLGEIDLRRDSEWGEAMLLSRARMRDALEEDRLETAANAILAVLPERAPAIRHRPANKSAVAEASVETLMAQAGKAIQLLTFIAHRAGRQGFGSGARKVLDDLTQDIHKRGEDLIADLRAEPENAELRALLPRAIWLVETLYRDERGRTLRRRLNNELAPSPQDDL